MFILLVTYCGISEFLPLCSGYISDRPSAALSSVQCVHIYIWEERKDKFPGVSTRRVVGRVRELLLQFQGYSFPIPSANTQTHTHLHCFTVHTANDRVYIKVGCWLGNAEAKHGSLKVLHKIVNFDQLCYCILLLITCLI